MSKLKVAEDGFFAEGSRRRLFSPKVAEDGFFADGSRRRLFSPKISIQKIRAISRKEYQLTSNISKKAYKANHTDVYLIDITDCNTQENDDKTDVYLIDTTDCNTQENDEKTEINIDSKKLDPILDKDGEVLDDNFIDEVFVKSDVESLNDDIDIDIFDDTDDFQTLAKDLDNDKEEKQIIDNIQPLKIKDNDVKKTVETTYESTDEIKSIQTMNDDFDNDDDFLDYDIDMCDDSDYIDRETNKEKYLSNNNITNSETTLNAVKEINSAIKSNNSTSDEEDEKKIIAEIQKRKDSDNFKKSKFICSVCFKGFQTSDLYKDHMLRHTDKFGSLECSICRIRVKSTLQLSQHEYIHRIMFRCRKCPFQTCHKSVADRHRRSHFGGAHKCSKCDFECRE
nr:zinc finger protein 1 homolog [Maniola hyperantus]